MKRLLLSLSSVAFLIGGCGGGPSSTPPPPVGKFSNASLKGQYAFSMGGQDGSSSAFITRVGSFTADGSGNITAATEDVINTGAPGGGRVQFTNGSYSIQANGKGTLTLNQASGGGLGLSITLTSSTAGLMVQMDYNGSLNATSSGSFSLQTPGDFAPSAINNNYVFSVSGIDAGAPLAMMGQITTDGGGNVQSGVIDVNDGNLLSPTPPAAIPSGGVYGADAANPNDLAAFGRGVIDFDGLTFVFYIVDHTHLLLLEEDGAKVTFGDALLQASSIPTQTSAFTPGSLAFLIGGGEVLGTMGPDARAARLTTDGSGNLTNVYLDENNDGDHSSVANNVSAANYAIDTSAQAAGRGRGTFTFTHNRLGTFTYVFYLVSQTSAVLQDQSAGLISSGSMLAQSGSISNSSLAGSYAFNWSGVVLPSSGNAGFEEDFVGQYQQTSSASIAGAVDFLELGSLSNRFPAFVNSAVSGNFTLNGDGSNSNDYKITISTSGISPNTYHFKSYVASAGTVFLVGTDDTQVLAGTVILQP